MSDDDKCRYTNILDRLKILDEQICQMQDTLKTVKDVMRKNLEERIAERDVGESTPEQIRATALETMRDSKKGEEK